MFHLDNSLLGIKFPIRFFYFLYDVFDVNFTFEMAYPPLVCCCVFHKQSILRYFLFIVKYWFYILLNSYVFGWGKFGKRYI